MCSPTEPIAAAAASAPAGRRPLVTYAVRVLGCKVNQCEAREIEREMERRGLRAAGGVEPADVVVVHGCAVTGAALAESRRCVAKHARGPAVVIASGCAAALLPRSVHCDAVVPAGPGWSAALARALDRLVRPAMAHGFAAAPRRFTGHARAFVKVQDGCDLGCSYCVVPALRGPPRDRPLPEIVQEVRRYAEAGHAEIVLSGVSIGLWGRAGGGELADVVAAAAGVPGVRRLRLSSLHPAEVTDRLLEVMRVHQNVAPHLHLPLQSGSDAVLHRMRRGYTVAEFLGAVRRVRAALDEPALTTDLIVGFPGETEEDFATTLNLCREVGFSRIHLFAFSPRPGTLAAAMADRLPAAVVRRRAEAARALARELAATWHRRWVGREVELLAERWEAMTGVARGHCARYCPIVARFERDPREGPVAVRVVAADESGLIAEPAARAV
ncbi:MAG: MiaB/RimO family radical SAM methylthiotransferase [Kiritimatiellae bacterium]|nr:MiaB/RimO family radical SAM methylthiotransferase [Kiritimatiellia bacterium]